MEVCPEAKRKQTKILSGCTLRRTPFSSFNGGNSKNVNTNVTLQSSQI